MKNNKAHITVPGLIVRGIFVISAIVLTFMLATGRPVSLGILVAFSAMLFFVQFINMMLGMNPLGMIIGMFTSIFALLMLKTLYSFPASWLGRVFINNMIYIAPTVAIVDVLRDLVD